jgi:hypothetical protein
MPDVDAGRAAVVNRAGQCAHRYRHSLLAAAALRPQAGPRVLARRRERLAEGNSKLNVPT